MTFAPLPPSSSLIIVSMASLTLLCDVLFALLQVMVWRSPPVDVGVIVYGVLAMLIVVAACLCSLLLLATLLLLTPAQRAAHALPITLKGSWPLLATLLLALLVKLAPDAPVFASKALLPACVAVDIALALGLLWHLGRATRRQS